MRIDKKGCEMLNVILIIPDIFVRNHVKYMVNMLLLKMKFKSIFIHSESVMATYAMALSQACVVDLGSTKTTVCCIDEGIINSKSVIRKHYGGSDVNEMLIRLINRGKALHYIPRNILNVEYHYHR
jgi:actin-related protein 8